MRDKYHHEALYCGEDATRKLAEVRLIICGAGALGSNLADTLARQGFRQFSIIDRDRIEEHNVSTQIYGEADVGAWKVEVLRSHLFRTAGIEIEVVNKELSERNVRKLLSKKDNQSHSVIIIDAFDNSSSRGLVQKQCRADGLACLHIGLSADYGEVIWDEGYRVPGDQGEDVCDYPMARNLVTMTVSVESLLRSILEGTQEN